MTEHADFTKGNSRVRAAFSPSVPDLSRHLRGKNASEQSISSDGLMLRKNAGRNTLQMTGNALSQRSIGTLPRDNSAGLSLINLYYDKDDEGSDGEQSNAEDASKLGQGEKEDQVLNMDETNVNDSFSSEVPDVAEQLPTPENDNDAIPAIETSLIEGADSSDVKKSHLDRYGFHKQNQHVSEKEYNSWWSDYSKYCIRRKRKWKDLLLKSGLPVDNDSPTRFPSQSEKLKRYVRKGIPAEWRGNAWWFFARGQELLNKNVGVYDKLLSKINDSGFSSKDTEIIERDLHRTFPDNIHFQKSMDSVDDPLIIKSLRRILKAFSIYNSKIGYCQSMNFLVGLLLLFMDEERAFWMLVIITNRYLPGVHSVNLEGVNINQGVLLLCIKEYLPQFWQRIYSNDSPRNTYKVSEKTEFLYKLPPITLCTASWFMSCFIGVVPIESTLRIWDCLFYEGSHVLFKMSLAIIELSEHKLPKLHHSKHRNADDEDMELFQVIQTYPKKMINPNDIIDKAIFKKRLKYNALNQEEIERCKKYVVSQRAKYKSFQDVLKSENVNGNKRDSKLAQDLIDETFSKEGYGFKKGLNGVNWNNNIRERVRRLSKKR